jgi:hypothetical protein
MIMTIGFANFEIYFRTHYDSIYRELSIVIEVKRRRRNWMGHVLRMEKSRLHLKALHLTPPRGNQIEPREHREDVIIRKEIN